MSESNTPNGPAKPTRPVKYPEQVDGKIICPVCRSEILKGEPVCWVCYGGQTVANRDNGASGGSKVAYVFGSIFAGFAISLGSILIGVVIAICTILAMVDSFLDSLGCAGALVMLGSAGWILINCSLMAFGYFL